MARRRKHRAKLNWVVILLVSFVVAFCILGTLQEKYDMELGLPKLNLPSADFVTEWLENFIGKDDGSRSTMRNAQLVSGEVMDGGLTVHVLDVGQADSVLIQAPGSTVLIDAGEAGDGGRVAQYLKAQGVTEIDLLIATHPHSDHIGGMDVVLDEFPVGKVLMSDLPDEIIPTTRVFTTFLEAVARSGAEVVITEPGQTYDLGDGAVLTIVGPVAQYGDLNNMSVVSRITYGDMAFLFCGDASAQSELGMADRAGDLSADVLQIPHHGSNSSSTELFLEWVGPSVALISCGLDNSYGHPHREVMERLRELGAEIYRTDLMGAIIVTTDGEQMYITTQRGED